MMSVADKPLSAVARAKLNLFLHVTGRRDDGYHLLDSLVVFTEFGDRLTVAPGADLTLNVSGPFSSDLATTPADDNLILRAAMALQSETGTRSGARISLEKHIPTGAGLGGGSADAATALCLLQRLWGVSLRSDRLAEIALSLGADVPVCLAGRPARMTGIGEAIEPLQGWALDIPVVLTHTQQSLSTPSVFRELTNAERGGAPAGALAIPHDTADLFEQLGHTRNDLAAAAIRLQPGIAGLLNSLQASTGCGLARMSGSGAACFGLFEATEAAEKAARDLSAQGYWAVSTRINAGSRDT